MRDLRNPPVWCRADLPTRQDEVFTTSSKEVIPREIDFGNEDRGVIPLSQNAVSVLQHLVSQHYTARQAQMAQLLMLQPTRSNITSSAAKRHDDGSDKLPSMINVDFLTDFYALMYIDAPCICNTWIDKHDQQYSYSVMSQPFAAGKVGSAYLVVPTWQIPFMPNDSFGPRPSLPAAQQSQDKRTTSRDYVPVSAQSTTTKDHNAEMMDVIEQSEQIHELTQPTKDMLTQSMLFIAPEYPSVPTNPATSAVAAKTEKIQQPAIPISLVLKGIQKVEIKSYLSMRTASYTPEMGNMNEAVRANRFGIAKQPGQYVCFAVGSDNFANQTCLHYILNNILKDVVPNYIYQYDAFICTDESRMDDDDDVDKSVPKDGQRKISTLSVQQHQQSPKHEQQQQRFGWLNPIGKLWGSSHSSSPSGVSSTLSAVNETVQTDPIEDTPVKTGMGYSITELATEGDLADFLTRNATILTVQDCEEMLTQILRPLRVLKQGLYGFVHADLKSRNVFVSRNQQPQLHNHSLLSSPQTVQKNKQKENELNTSSSSATTTTNSDRSRDVPSRLPADIVYKIGDLDKSSIHYHGIRFYNNTWEILTQWTPTNLPINTGVINKDISPNDRTNQYYQFGGTLMGLYISFQPFTMFNQFGFYTSYDIYTLFISLMLEPVFYKIYTDEVTKVATTSPLTRAWQFLWFDPEDFKNINSFIGQQHLQLEQLPPGPAQRSRLKEMRRITFINQVLMNLKLKLRVDIDKVYDLFDVQIPPSLVAETTLPQDFFTRPMTISNDNHLCLSTCGNHGGSYYSWCRTNRYSKRSIPLLTTSTVYDWDYCTA